MVTNKTPGVYKIFSNQWDNNKNREQSATIWRIYAMMLEGKG